jgi:hypothetical protein
VSLISVEGHHASTEAADLAAVAEAEKEVEAIQVHHPAKQSAAKEKVTATSVPAKKLDHNDEAGTQLAETNQAQENKVGELQPGQKGWLEQHIQGRDHTFKETMAKIDKHLDAKYQHMRQKADDAHKMALLAKQAGEAAAQVAHGVCSAAESNANEKAAAALSCSKQMNSAGEDEKQELATKCSALLEEQQAAFAEADQALEACKKAMDSAGVNMGEFDGKEKEREDGSAVQVDAKNAALEAKLKLDAYNKQVEQDRQFRQSQLIQEKKDRVLKEQAEAMETNNIERSGLEKIQSLTPEH